ncbi:MAG: methionyl-tRNA formyltransferase [Candidatus Omnitrophota bacterium]
MKIIFFGSSNFAIPILDVLIKEEDVALIVTQPDRKKGRDLAMGHTPVKDYAEKNKIKIYQPLRVNDSASIAYLKKADADLFVVVSFGQILSRAVLAVPKKFSLNVHASLLPKYRGAAPINRAIAGGEKATGVTIMRMNEKMDEGDIVLQGSVRIDDEDDAVSLAEKLSRKGAELVRETLRAIRNNELDSAPQDSAKATYAPKLKKDDGLIDWTGSAEEIRGRVRAFVPWPGCFTYLDKKMLKIWKAEPAGAPAEDARPGEVLKADKDGILVKTGKGVLRIKELQLEGSRRMTAEEFIAGHKLTKFFLRK